MSSTAARKQSVPDALARRLSQARTLSDDLFRMVRPDALLDRPIAERHRILFYMGHLEAFDWNLMTGTLFDLSPIDGGLDRLFAFGIDPVGGGLPDDRPSDWPALPMVRDYCRRLRMVLDCSIAELPEDGGTGPGSADQILNVAIEHRLMHVETLAYMLHWLPPDHKMPGPRPPASAASSPIRPAVIPIPAGTATLGLPRNGAFGWDNEFLEHTVEVPAFAIDRCKVSNGEFLEFVRAGGYSDRSLWSGVDWEWKDRAGISHPKFWFERNGAWFWRAMFDELPLPPGWPAYVSHAEASAYARWVDGRLPTEAEFHRAAYGTPAGGEREYPWGSDPPAPHRGNFDLARWNPEPVNAYPGGDSAFGVSGLVGNGWEWTETEFRPFGGFEAFSFYPGYSADFFDGRHFVMKGGSPRTAACLLRRSFRNWFQPHYPNIYAGFRCVARERRHA
jgi:ergothioneine biosynthesis protein EgtB